MQLTVQDILSRIRLLNIKSKKHSTDLLAGDYSTAFKGRGMSFSEVRDYNYGDDVRAIDWNVSARFNHPYIKVFEVEREMCMMLLVDVSASTMFGTQGRSKQELIAELLATLAFSAAKTGDKVGAVFFAEEVLEYFPPQKGSAHLMRILTSFLAQDAKANTGSNITVALQHIAKLVKQRSVSFLLSDMHSKDYNNALRICARKHDLVGMHVYDTHDATLPNIGLLHVQDLETKKVMLVNTNSATVRTQYEQSFKAIQQTAKQHFLQAGARFVSINTNDNYHAQLHAFFRGLHA
ncbi:MAG: hypothetical protein RL660_259 [Bacteroidota bacterium]